MKRETDASLPLDVGVGEEKKKKDRSNSLPDTAKAGQNCRDGWDKLLPLWSCWGSEQRKVPPRPETTPEQKRYRPRVSKPLGMTQAGRFARERLGLGRQFSTNRNLQGGLGSRGVKGTGTSRGTPVDPGGAITVKQTHANARWAIVCPTASTATSISRRPASTSTSAMRPLQHQCSSVLPAF